MSRFIPRSGERLRCLTCSLWYASGRTARLPTSAPCSATVGDHAFDAGIVIVPFEPEDQRFLGASLDPQEHCPIPKIHQKVYRVRALEFPRKHWYSPDRTGNAADHPLRARRAEQFLLGRPATAEAFVEAGWQAAWEAARVRSLTPASSTGAMPSKCWASERCNRPLQR